MKFSVKTVCAREYVDNALSPLKQKIAQAYTMVFKDVPLTGLSWKANEAKKIILNPYMPKNAKALFIRFSGNDALYMNNYYITGNTMEESWLYLVSTKEVTKTNYPCSVCFLVLIT